MLPGMGGFEAVVIALLALVIVGPKDLPILMRRLARWVNKVRGMAAEFRMSFDELARQSELDELRREVEALRRGDPLEPVRAEIEPVARDLHASLNDLHDDTAYRAAVDEANGAAVPAAEDPYLPSFEPGAPTPSPATPPATAAAEPAPQPSIDPTPPAPRRPRRKAEPAAAGGDA